MPAAEVNQDWGQTRRAARREAVQRRLARAIR